MWWWLNSLTHLLTHSLTHTHTPHSHTSLTHLTHTPHSLTHSLAHSLTHSLTHSGAVRLPPAWQAQYTEPSGGAAARVAAAGPRLPFVWQAQYTELEEELRRAWLPLGRGYLSCGRRSTQSLQYTTLLPTNFDTPSVTPLCHTPSFTHKFVSHHLSDTILDTPILTHHLSHTTLSHTIFHTPSVTHHLSQHFVTHRQHHL